jgi:hypothetical protein
MDIDPRVRLENEIGIATNPPNHFNFRGWCQSAMRLSNWRMVDEGLNAASLKKTFSM